MHRGVAADQQNIFHRKENQQNIKRPNIRILLCILKNGYMTHFWISINIYKRANSVYRCIQ